MLFLSIFTILTAQAATWAVHFFHFNMLLLSFISRQLLKVHMVKTSAATSIKPLLSSPSTNSLLLLAALHKLSIALGCYCKRVPRNLNWGRVIYYPVQHSPAPFSE